MRKSRIVGMKKATKGTSSNPIVRRSAAGKVLKSPKRTSASKTSDASALAHRPNKKLTKTKWVSADEPSKRSIEVIKDTGIRRRSAMKALSDR